MLALGYRSVRELLQGMRSRDLTEWKMYSYLEPFGEERADLRAGIIASVIATVNSGESFSPAYFMPFAEKPKKKKQTQAEMEAALDGFAAAFNIPKTPPGGRHGNDKQT